MNMIIIPKKSIQNNYDNRKQRRASLRLAGQRIVFYGRGRYRFAMANFKTNSIFDMNDNDLAGLAGLMRE